MPSALDPFASTRYDLLVIGGGIHGLFAAYDAAQRGLTVALVDRADFGSGLTFNHQRTIHGGLRSLGSGRIGKTRRQIDERRNWARIAPHLLRPLPFLIGTYGWTTRSRWAVRAGFRVYDLVGRKRNRHVSPELHLPRARLESAAATRRLFPGVTEPGLSGGAIWYDYQTRHPDRLAWTVALAARRAGAVLANWVQAETPLRAGGRVVGARVRDVITGRESDIEARVTIVAAGADARTLAPAFGIARTPPLLRAMNLLINRPARDIATAAPARSGRILTAVPWRGFVLVGTDQSDSTVEGSEPRPPAGAVEAFLADANATFSRLRATAQDIRLVHHGLTPAVVRNGKADLLPEPAVTRQTGDGAGVISLVGVKFTTARSAAERAVDAACAELAGRFRRSRTAATPLPHADIADVEGRLIETLRELDLALDRDVMEHLTSWYGTEASDVVRYAAQANLLDRLSPETPVLTAEMAYAVDHAQARALSDAVLRRTPLGSAGHPGRAAIERAAEIVSGKLGWTAERRASEIEAVEGVYPEKSGI
jgi:glycerol-3-phosphate dehydrogenase